MPPMCSSSSISANSCRCTGVRVLVSALYFASVAVSKNGTFRATLVALTEWLWVVASSSMMALYASTGFRDVGSLLRFASNASKALWVRTAPAIPHLSRLKPYPLGDDGVMAVAALRAEKQSARGWVENSSGL